MSDMQAFYKMLTTTTNERDRHSDALAAITKADREQLSALSSELAWQTWSATTAEA
jgi:hypothetical protein